LNASRVLSLANQHDRSPSTDTPIDLLQQSGQGTRVDQVGSGMVGFSGVRGGQRHEHPFHVGISTNAHDVQLGAAHAEVIRDKHLAKGQGVRKHVSVANRQARVWRRRTSAMWRAREHLPQHQPIRSCRTAIPKRSGRSR